MSSASLLVMACVYPTGLSPFSREATVEPMDDEIEQLKVGVCVL